MCKTSGRLNIGFFPDSLLILKQTNHFRCAQKRYGGYWSHESQLPSKALIVHGISRIEQSGPCFSTESSPVTTQTNKHGNVEPLPRHSLLRFSHSPLASPASYIIAAWPKVEYRLNKDHLEDFQVLHQETPYFRDRDACACRHRD
jgi:hypothetical protein